MVILYNLYIFGSMLGTVPEFSRAQILLPSNLLPSSFIFQMPGCTFQSKWLSDERFKGWLKEVPNNRNTAECTVCQKTVDLSTMGSTALTSNAKGVKHSRNLSLISSQGSLHSYVDKQDITVTRQCQSDTATNACPAVDTFVSKTETLKAEIWWSLKTINSNSSFSSNEDVSFFLKRCFQIHK